MPSVQEILLQSGLTQTQIDALDAKAITAFSGVLTTAEAERKTATEAAAKAAQDVITAKAAQDAAELAKRAGDEFYTGTVVPSLTGWEDQQKVLQTEVANAKALAAFYEAQNKAAKEAGFVAADAPAFVVPAAAVIPARDGTGKFVTGVPGGTPGSPTFTMEEFENRLGNGLDNSVWALQEYQRLSGGQFLPDSVSQLAQEANAQKLPFKDYVARKYDFATRRATLQAKAEEEKKATWLAEATKPLQDQLKQKDIDWQAKLEAEKKAISERGGNNPDVRRAAISNYPEVKKAIAEGTRKDPLSMNREERQIEMRKQIQADVNANEEAKQGVAA